MSMHHISPPLQGAEGQFWAGILPLEEGSAQLVNSQSAPPYVTI